MLLRVQSISVIAMIAWTVAWLVAVVALAYFWDRLPVYVAWPLSILELIFIPDIVVLKNMAFKTMKGKYREERDVDN